MDWGRRRKLPFTPRTYYMRKVVFLVLNIENAQRGRLSRQIDGIALFVRVKLTLSTATGQLRRSEVSGGGVHWCFGEEIVARSLQSRSGIDRPHA